MAVSLTIGKAGDFFFDSAKIRKSVRDAGQDPRRLSKAGSFVRRTARQSLRVAKKKSSEPGKPPRVRKSGSLFRRILFEFDPHSKTMVVGPVRVNRKLAGQSTVPQMQEFGGSAPILTFRENVKEKRKRRRRVKRTTARQRRAFRQRVSTGQQQSGTGNRFFERKPTVRRTATYPKRQFMEPALMQNLSKFPQLFNNSVR